MRVNEISLQTSKQSKMYAATSASSMAGGGEQATVRAPLVPPGGGAARGEGQGQGS